MSKLSTIITAYDQHPLTVAHIKGCMESSYLPKEIIVVNDGGSPDLVDMIKSIPDRKCKIVYAFITKDIPWNQQGARNLGVWLSTGEYIANEDNDHIPYKNFYQEAVDILDRGESDIITVKTRTVVELDDVLNKPIEQWVGIRSRGHASIISTIKREVLVISKGFDEQYSGAYGWEIPDWRFRVELYGFKVVFNGCYYTPAGVYSKQADREWDGKHWKMDAVNYHHWRRTEKNRWKQSPIGILNFNYEVEVI